MNWVQELLDLYEKRENEAGDMIYLERKTKKGDIKIPLVLLPVSHTTVLAQITVTIDAEGNFLKAETAAEDDRVTIIPITEKSGSRTAGVEPHPLCDNLKYLAGDYMDYYAGKEGKEKDYSQNHELYMRSLRAWNNSEFTHKKVQAVYRYLLKGCLIKDLVSTGILQLDDHGKMEEGIKIMGISQADSFVRFRILESGEFSAEMLEDDTGRYLPECWKDKTLFRSFIDYYKTCTGVHGLSYLTGNQDAISYLHPKKIRNEGDGGKLFSSNDETYFTFRGRFTDKSEAVAIGYMDSQKIHNALKWIIRKQGYSWDDLTVVIWSSDLKPLPDMKADTDTICEEAEGLIPQYGTSAGPEAGYSRPEDVGDDGYEDDDGWGDELEEEEISPPDTDEPGAARFRRAMWGYESQMDQMSRTVLLALDSATPGRVSMSENRVFLSSNYIRNLSYWHDSCRWLHTKYKNGQRKTYTGMTGVESLAKILYGTEQNGVLTLPGNAKLIGELYKRLLPCIAERRKIPDDLVRLAVHRASSPMSFKEWYNWENVLETACSLVKKQFYDKNPREEWKVALDKECNKRDYLYGRLLAVGHYAEFRTYSKEERRDTNAQRYMTAFSQWPMQTWKVIEEKLLPYWPRLKAQEADRYRNLMADIFQKFTVESYEEDKPLGGLYLLGFHSQLAALNKIPEGLAKDKDPEEGGISDNNRAEG